MSILNRINSKSGYPFSEQSSISKEKYLKFQGSSSTKKKKQLNMNSLSKINKTNLSYLTKNYEGVTLLISPKIQKNHKSKFQAHRKEQSKHNYFASIIEQFHSLLDSLREIIDVMKVQSRRVFNIIKIQMKQNILKFLNSKMRQEPLIVEPEDLFNYTDPIKFQKNLQIIRTESISTDYQRFKPICQPSIQTKTHQLKHPIKLKNQLRQQADNEDSRTVRIRQGHNNMKISRKESSSSAQSRLRKSRDKSVSQKIKGLQNRLEEIKNSLSH